MIQIKPLSMSPAPCPCCGKPLRLERTLWQGIHVCLKQFCNACGEVIVDDLPVGHAINYPYRAAPDSARLWGRPEAQGWLGEPFLASLRSPRSEHKSLKIERINSASSVVILNCLDYLYGHCLLKLLNAETCVKAASERGLGVVLLIPRSLRWMVPDGVSEIWTADIGLGEAQCYFPILEEAISRECDRFEAVYIDRAHSHPTEFALTRFTQAPVHDFSGFDSGDFRITFIWREDRPWVSRPLLISRRLGFPGLPLLLQADKVQRLFKLLRRRLPKVRFTVAGLGKNARLPAWIEDHRVEKFNEESERRLCHVYSESRFVIGVHGSSMLLPSGHAGMTLDLMPHDRWENIAQDILYGESEPRLAAHKHTYVPIDASLTTLASIICGHLFSRQEVVNNFKMTEGLVDVSRLPLLAVRDGAPGE